MDDKQPTDNQPQIDLTALITDITQHQFGVNHKRHDLKCVLCSKVTNRKTTLWIRQISSTRTITRRFFDIECFKKCFTNITTDDIHEFGLLSKRMQKELRQHLSETEGRPKDFVPQKWAEVYITTCSGAGSCSHCHSNLPKKELAIQLFGVRFHPSCAVDGRYLYPGSAAATNWEKFSDQQKIQLEAIVGDLSGKKSTNNDASKDIRRYLLTLFREKKILNRETALQNANKHFDHKFKMKTVNLWFDRFENGDFSCKANCMPPKRKLNYLETDGPPAKVPKQEYGKQKWHEKLLDQTNEHDESSKPVTFKCSFCQCKRSTNNSPKNYRRKLEQWMIVHMTECPVLLAARDRLCSTDNVKLKCHPEFIYQTHFNDTIHSTLTGTYHRSCFYAFQPKDSRHFSYYSFLKNYIYFGHARNNDPDPYNRKMIHHVESGRLIRLTTNTVHLLYSKDTSLTAKAEATAIALCKQFPRLTNLVNETATLYSMTTNELFSVTDSLRFIFQRHYAAIELASHPMDKEQTILAQYEKTIEKAKWLASQLPNHIVSSTSHAILFSSKSTRHCSGTALKAIENAVEDVQELMDHNNRTS